MVSQVVPMGTPMGVNDNVNLPMHQMTGGVPVLPINETELARNEYLLQKANRGDDVLGGVGQDPKTPEKDRNITVTLADITRQGAAYETINNDQSRDPVSLSPSVHKKKQENEDFSDQKFDHSTSKLQDRSQVNVSQITMINDHSVDNVEQRGDETDLNELVMDN